MPSFKKYYPGVHSRFGSIKKTMIQAVPVPPPERTWSGETGPPPDQGGGQPEVPVTPPLANPLSDNYQSYSPGDYIDGLDGGTPVGPPLGRTGKFVPMTPYRRSHPRPITLDELIDWAGYWTDAYTARGSFESVQMTDDFELYLDGTNVSGINLGTSNVPVSAWVTGYTARASFTAVQLTDDFESYTDSTPLNGLNLGTSNPPGSIWTGAWIARASNSAARASDDFESYSDSSALDGANLGTGWPSAYIVHLYAPPPVLPDTVPRPNDDMESYTISLAVNGLNGGANWSGAYVARDSFAGVHSRDDAESYTVGATVVGLNGGTGWSGAYVAH